MEESGGGLREDLILQLVEMGISRDDAIAVSAAKYYCKWFAELPSRLGGRSPDFVYNNENFPISRFGNKISRFIKKATNLHVQHHVEGTIK